MTTAFVTDTRYAAHTLDGHPEYAGRLEAVQRQLGDDGLTTRLLCLESRRAEDAALRAVHAESYLTLLERTSHLTNVAMLGPDTYILPISYETARLAAGGVMRVVDAVLRGEASNGIAAIRPPGHHATPEMGMGFCLLNNIAIAARYAQRDHGIERVLIVDYDVHHGNGTQDVFYTDPSVLYVSTHQYPLYPGTGAMGDTGEGDGAGCTLNIPLTPGIGNAGYAKVFEEVIIPVARRFAPNLILVSAGFDAHWADPLANMRLSLAGYDRLTRALITLADELCAGRIVFVMEGGYNLAALSHAWANVARALLGDSTVIDPLGLSPNREPIVEPLVERLKRIHKLD
jgi:acetoin utilization deacetylase AcuC-like enzyme